MSLEKPAFEARLADGTWLRVYANGTLEGAKHDIIINRIPVMINQAVAESRIRPSQF